MTNTDKQYSIKLSRFNFNSANGVNREIDNLNWIIKDFESEAVAREKRERDERIMCANAEKAKRIVNEHAVLMELVSENPIFVDKFKDAMNRTTS